MCINRSMKRFEILITLVFQYFIFVYNLACKNTNKLLNNNIKKILVYNRQVLEFHLPAAPRYK